MKNLFLIFALIFNASFLFGQDVISGKRFNHILSVGATNSVFANSFEGMNDWNGYSKQQIGLDYEFGYLLSYQLNKKIEIKTGLNLRSWVKSKIEYYGYNKTFSDSNPNIPILIEFQNLFNSNYFISTGVKLSYHDDYKSAIHYAGDDLSPEAIIEVVTNQGINPIITLGFGKRNMIRDKYRLEWLLTYNQGTNSLIQYRFLRFDPDIESILNVNNSHLSFTLRYYFMKYRQNE